jgi:uncharacterized membrane protein
MEDSSRPVSPVLPVVQLGACALAAVTGLAFAVSEIFGDDQLSWAYAVLGLVGLAAAVLLWRSPAGRNPVATYVGGVLVPVLLIVVTGFGLFGVYGLVVLVATVFDVVRHHLAAREGRR